MSKSPVNVAKSSSNSAFNPAAMITKAFGFTDTASIRGANGIQTMAAGVMAYYAEAETTTAAGKPTMKALSEKGDAFNVYKAAMVEALVKGEVITPRITAKEVKADKKITTQQAVDANAKNSAQMLALNKGFDLAFALTACGVSLQSFDAKLNLFTVPAATFLAEGDTATGSLKDAIAKNKLIALDGKTYRKLTSDDKTLDFKAYPAEIISLAGYKTSKKAKATETVKGASDTTTSGGASADKVKADPSTWSLGAMLKAAAELLNKSAAVLAEGGEPMGWSSLDEQMRNDLNAVSIFIDECKAADKMTSNNASKAA